MIVLQGLQSTLQQIHLISAAHVLHISALPFFAHPEGLNLEKNIMQSDLQSTCVSSER